MRFKLVIKPCTKLDFDLVQNSTGPCSLTGYPCSCPIVPWRSCGYLTQAGCHQLLPPWPPSTWLAQGASKIKQLCLSSFSCHFWAWSKTRIVWTGLRAPGPVGLLVGHGKMQTSPIRPLSAFLVTKAIPRQGLEWPVLACRP